MDFYAIPDASPPCSCGSRKKYPLFDEKSNVSPFSGPLGTAHKSKTFLHSLPWDHPYPALSFQGVDPHGSITKNYALALPSLLPSCCGSPVRSLHKFRSLARTLSQPRTRAIQPEKGLHGTCLAMATGEIPDRSLIGRCYRFGPQIQLRIPIQRVLIGIASCVPLTSGYFFCTVLYCCCRDKNSMARKSFEIKHFYAIRAKKILLPDRARVRSATLLLANGYYFWSK